MTRRLVMLGVLVLGLAGGLGFAQTDDGLKLDPLLELLVKKGVITEAEATALQAEAAAKEAPVEPAPASAMPAAQPAPAPAAAPAAAELPAALKGLKIGTTTYLSYQDGSANNSSGVGQDYSKFVLKRGYIDIRKEVAPYLGFRITPDIYLDSSGNTNVRMKYLHAAFKKDELGFIGKPYVEFGMAHMPWLDFEENINRFRMQDTMFMERNGLFNSADLGVFVAGNFGKELPKEYRETVNSAQAGRWGSFGVGLYNGGGYNQSEKNSNKVLEGRVSLRPLPDIVPGLQASVFAISGKGNVEDTATLDPPDWEVLAGMVSYESRRLVLTGQYEEGKGNQRGTAVDASGTALDHDGYSFFTEVRLDEAQKYSLFGRYDRFDPNTDDPAADVSKRTIVGFAWQFVKNNYWVLDYDRLEHSTDGRDTEDRVQLTLQIKY
jgi:hypothetical protein